MSKFGWSLPPGCSTLPGEEDEQLDNQYLAEAFVGAVGPYDLQRQVYRYTTCGAALSFLIAYEKEPETEADAGPLGDGPQDVVEWFHDGDKLFRQLTTWQDFDEAGMLITAIMVSSIVEGVDLCVDGVTVELDQLEEEPSEFVVRFDAAVKEVEREALQIWTDTHGCEDCGPEGDYGYVAINPECPTCQGEGTIL